MMNVGIVGSRDYPKLELILGHVQKLPKDTIVVSGGARGVDTAAEEAAEECHLDTVIFEPDFSKHPWSDYGPKAYFERNKEIVHASDKIVAFWDLESSGTKDTIEYAKKKGVPVTIFGPGGAKYSEEKRLDDF